MTYSSNVKVSAAYNEVVRHYRKLFKLIRSYQRAAADRSKRTELLLLMKSVERCTEDLFTMERRLLEISSQIAAQEQGTVQRRILQSLAAQHAQLHADRHPDPSHMAHVLDALLVHHFGDDAQFSCRGRCGALAFAEEQASTASED